MIWVYKKDLCENFALWKESKILRSKSPFITLNISFLASANCFPRLSLLQEWTCPKWSAWLLFVSPSFIKYVFCQAEKKPSPRTYAVLSTSCSSETSSSSGRWESEPNPPNPIYCGKSEDRTPMRNIWLRRWPPPVLDVSSFRKCWDTAKPQKLVKVLGKDRGIQAYVGSGDGVTSVMSNKRAWKCITLEIGKIRGLAREDSGLEIVEDMDKLRTRPVPPHIRKLPTLPLEPHTDGNSLCDCFRMWLPSLTWFPVMQISRAGRYRGAGMREMLLGIQRYIILGHGMDVKLSNCLVLLLIHVTGLLDWLWNLMSRASFRYKILILIMKYFYLFF